MATKRIIDLEQQATLSDGSWVMTDNTTNGTKRYDLNDLVQKTEADAIHDEIETLKTKDERFLGNVLSATATGNIVHATDSYNSQPLKLTVNGSSVQDGTPTPSAPVAIDSVDSVEAWFTGSNILPKMGAGTTSGVTFAVVDDGTITLSGKATATVNKTWPDISFADDTTVTLSGCPSGGGASSYQIWIWDLTTQRTSGIEDTGSGSTGTLLAGHNYSVRIRVQNGYTCSNVVIRPQLELGSTKTTYKTYSAQTVLIDLQGFGLRSLPNGTRDTFSVDGSGNVTITRRVGVITLDGSSDEAWTYSTSANYSDPSNGKYCYYTNIDTPNAVADYNTLVENTVVSGYRMILSSELISNKEHYTATWSGSASARRFTIETPYATLDILKKHLANSNITYLYPLATATTESLGQVSLRELRSLPDGTHDELVVDADGNMTLVQRVGMYKVTQESAFDGGAAVGSYTRVGVAIANNVESPNAATRLSAAEIPTKELCTYAPIVGAYDGQDVHCYVNQSSNGYTFLQLFYQGSAADVKAAYIGAKVIYELANPQTYDLGTVTLPALPAPDMTAWAVTDPSTAIALDYERDLTIAINNLESAIAELATS